MDLYAELGVGRDAAAEDIKKAYRKLALQCHPDKNAGNADAQGRFQRVSSAYAVLSDARKREVYDRHGTVDDADVSPEEFMAMFQEMILETIGGFGMIGEMLSCFTPKELSRLPPFPFPKELFPPGTFPPGMRFSSQGLKGVPSQVEEMLQTGQLGDLFGGMSAAAGFSGPRPQRSASRVAGRRRAAGRNKLGSGRANMYGMGSRTGPGPFPPWAFEGFPAGMFGGILDGDDGLWGVDDDVDDDASTSDSDAWTEASDDEALAAHRDSSPQGDQEPEAQRLPPGAGVAREHQHSHQQHRRTGTPVASSPSAATAAAPVGAAEPSRPPQAPVPPPARGQSAPNGPGRSSLCGSSAAGSSGGGSVPAAASPSTSTVHAGQTSALGPQLVREWIMAARGSDLDIMAALLAAEPRLLACRGSGMGHTALHWCAAKGSVGGVRWLLAKGADVNVRNDEGATPLHAAARNGQLEAVHTLLSHQGGTGTSGAGERTSSCGAASTSGADPWVTDDEGRTALQLAQEFKHTAVAEVLAAAMHAATGSAVQPGQASCNAKASAPARGAAATAVATAANTCMATTAGAAGASAADGAAAGAGAQAQPRAAPAPCSAGQALQGCAGAPAAAAEPAHAAGATADHAPCCGVQHHHATNAAASASPPAHSGVSVREPVPEYSATTAITAAAVAHILEPKPDRHEAAATEAASSSSNSRRGGASYANVDQFGSPPAVSPSTGAPSHEAPLALNGSSAGIRVQAGDQNGSTSSNHGTTGGTSSGAGQIGGSGGASGGTGQSGSDGSGALGGGSSGASGGGGRRPDGGGGPGKSPPPLSGLSPAEKAARRAALLAAEEEAEAEEERQEQLRRAAAETAAKTAGVSRDEGRAWMEAAKAGQVDKLRAMLRANPSLLMYKGQGTSYAFTGHTALHWAVAQGQVDAARWLLQQGADPDAVNEAGAAPLHAAASQGRDSCARLLAAEVCAKLQVQDGLGETPQDILLRLDNQGFSHELGVLSRLAALRDADPCTWTPKAMRTALMLAGVDPTPLLEKPELVAACKEMLANKCPPRLQCRDRQHQAPQQPHSAAGPSAGASAAVPPKAAAAAACRDAASTSGGDRADAGVPGAACPKATAASSTRSGTAKPCSAAAGSRGSSASSDGGHYSGGDSEDDDGGGGGHTAAAAADAARLRGNEAFGRGEHSRAVQQYSMAIRLAPAPSAVLYSNRSAAYCGMSYFGKAQTDAEEAIRLDPKVPKYHCRRGAGQLGQRQWADAIASFKQALALEPGYAAAVSGIEDAKAQLQRQNASSA